MDEELRAARVQHIVDRLVKVSGAIVGISRAGRTSLYASGIYHTLLRTRMSGERVSRAGSIM